MKHTNAHRTERIAIIGAIVLSACGLAPARGDVVVAVEAVEGDAEGLAEEVANAAQAVVRVLAPQPAAAAVEVADDAAPAPAEQVDPFLAMFKPILVAELSFAKRTCKLTPEQLDGAIAASKTWLLDYAQDYAKKNGQPQLNVRFMAVQQQQSSPRDDIEAGVVAEVKKLLTAEQAPKYEAELAKRSDFRRRAVADTIVAGIDSRVCLTPKQRQQIRESLLSKWDSKWAPQLDNLVHNGEYLPQVPDNLVVKFLNADQREMWKGIQKVNFGNFFNGDQGFINGGQGIADVDVGELKAAKSEKPDGAPAPAAAEPAAATPAPAAYYAP